jgi:hypothetical protein
MASSNNMSTSKKPPNTVIATTSNLETSRFRQSNNLETYTLLWLDGDINKKDNVHTQGQLKRVINQFKAFDNVGECENYIEVKNDQKIILIISGGLGRQLVPKLHSLQQIVAIYIYCMNKEVNEQWSKNYGKVSNYNSNSTCFLSG